MQSKLKKKTVLQVKASKKQSKFELVLHNLTGDSSEML